MILLGLGLLSLLLYFVFRHQDRRMLRNGVALVIGLLLVLAGALDLLWEEVPALHWLLAKAVVLALAGMLLLGVFLIVNGITMARREGRSLGNLLSLVAGLGIFMSPAAVIGLLNAGTLLAVVTVPLAALIFFGVGYLGLVFLIFLTYAVVYGRTRHQVRPAAVVVLGCQLIEGRVPPLLASRLDRALEIYRQTQDPKPLLIPSGGQGEDESRSEGEGMAEYLVDHGADPSHVIAEVRAANTEQNLRFSVPIYDDAVQRGAAQSGPLLVATSNYHVLRAALLARRLKLDAEVVGARTAAYYVPSAFLREFVVILRGHLFLHAVLFASFIALAASFFVLFLH